MSDKDKYQKDDFEIEFEEDNETGNEVNNGINDKVGDNGEEDFRVDFDYDEFVDDSDMKVKLSKNQIFNRIMAGLGIAIAGFTIFYGVVAYGMIRGHHENNSGNNTEPETVVEQPESVQQPDDGFFISNNSDENISEEVKKLLNNEKLDSMRTGLSKVDKSVSEIMKVTCKDDMTTYDKVRNIYDYMMYNYSVKSTSYVDFDAIYDYCSFMDYISEYDMELVYRAGKLFKDKTGDSKDYACGFTVLLRNMGLEAYYIDGEKKDDYNDYSSHGYTVVMLDGEMYIFDVAEEDLLSGDGETVSEIETENNSLSTEKKESGAEGKTDEQQNNNKVEYKVFCKTFDELDGMYSEEGVEDSINSFEKFKGLAEFSFSANVSTDGGEYSSSSVTYREDDNVAVLDDLYIDLYDNVYFKGSVSGSKKNTWKLIVRVYDDDMNYITESTLYNETISSSDNEVTYRAGRGGYMKLLYVVTDEHGRTCTASVKVHVNDPEEETEDVTEYTRPTDDDTASDGQLSAE